METVLAVALFVIGIVIVTASGLFKYPFAILRSVWIGWATAAVFQYHDQNYLVAYVCFIMACVTLNCSMDNNRRGINFDN